jgi:hypothetical protein
MKIQLDHVQRLNLHALLGAQRDDVATIRAIWAIQDKIALTPAEEKAIELKCEVLVGQERVTWKPTLAISAKEFDFTDAEVTRLRGALQCWDGHGASADRRWLEPLLDALAAREPRL